MKKSQHEVCGGTTIDAEFERRTLRANRVLVLTGDLESGSAREFIEDIKMLLLEDSTDPITITISSPGGNVFCGIAVIRAIRSVQSRGIKVFGDVHGQAMSMAFFILQCCDERRMGSFCTLMAHGITTGFIGDMRNVEAEQKLLTFWQREIAQLIANRCTAEGTEYAEIGYWFAILKDNTPQFYDSQESKEMGLIDTVYDDNKNQKNTPKSDSS